jgi:hypothetical protein
VSAVKVGDRVRLSYLRVKMPGTVLALDGQFAWVKWDKLTRPESVHAVELVPANPANPA